MRREKTRATLIIGPETVTKQFRNPTDADTEISWYQQLPPGIAPQILHAEDDVLVITKHPPAKPERGPLIQLLQRLQSLGIHHRDVHPGNIVQGPDGPLLIDWETAIHATAPSYDLHGPEVSGIPIPAIHQALGTGYCMWLHSSHRLSIRNQWRH